MWRKLTCWLHSATWGTQDTQTRDRAEEVGRKGEICKEEVVGVCEACDRDTPGLNKRTDSLVHADTVF